MTPASPTWGDVEAFLAADNWERVPSSARGGRRQRHIFYRKLLDDGRLLETHISHDRGASISPGRFSSILREQLEVSKDDFWTAISTGEPVDRPVPVDEEEAPEHEVWVIRVLQGELHMTAKEIAELSVDEAVQRVYEHWATPADD